MMFKTFLHKAFRRCGFNIVRIPPSGIPVEPCPGECQRYIQIRSLYDIFPGIENISATIPCSQIFRGKGTLPLSELTILAGITRYLSPLKIFEFGTFTGASTLVLAMSAPKKAEVHTLDLPPQDGFAECPAGQGDISFLSYEVGRFYKNTPFKANIRQIYGNSRQIDLSSFRGTMDLVFVDGNHDYEIAKKDTENAFMMLRYGGVIIWDDYHPVFGPGVIKALGEMSDRPVYQIDRTRFGCYINR